MSIIASRRNSYSGEFGVLIAYATQCATRSLPQFLQSPTFDLTQIPQPFSTTAT